MGTLDFLVYPACLGVSVLLVLLLLVFFAAAAAADDPVRILLQGTLKSCGQQSD